MKIAVANKDFIVALIPDDGKTTKFYQVANGEDLKLLSGCMRGVTKSGGHGYNGTQVIAGYLVEIDGQTVFLDESLMEVSQ
jgi:hypothetical protein